MNELLQGSLADAIVSLAKLAASLEKHPLTYAEKQALSGTDLLSSLGSTVSNNPALSHALVGGGVGAGLGGLHAMVGNSGKPEEERKGWLGSALTGGLAGAGIGAGVGAARTGLANLKGPGGGVSSPAVEPTQPGEFTITGLDGQPQKRMINPDSLKNNPDLAGRIKQLTTPTLPGRAVGGISDAYHYLRDQAPEALFGIPAVGATDAGYNFLARRGATPERAGGYYGRQFYNKGLDATKDMREGVRDLLRKAPGHYGDTHIDMPGYTPKTPNLLQRLTGAKGTKTVADILGSTSYPETGDQSLLNITKTKMEKEPREIMTYGKGTTGKEQYIDSATGKQLERDIEIGKPQVESKQKKLYPEQVHAMQADGTPKYTNTTDPVTGALLPHDKWKPEMENARESIFSTNPSEVAATKSRGFTDSKEFEGRALKRFPGTNKMYRGMKHPVAGRALAYGGLGALDWLGHGFMDDRKDQLDLNALMQEHSRPAPAAPAAPPSKPSWLQGLTGSKGK